MTSGSEKPAGHEALKVYLAGPGVFRPDAAAFGHKLKEKCARAGLLGCFPLDGDGGEGTLHEKAAAIFRANVRLIDSATAIIADISPFRGPNMDPGTAWEIGYGIAKGLPVFAWSDNRDALFDRTRQHSGAPGAEARHDAKGWLIEDFQLAENLMIAVSVTAVYHSDDEAIAACAAALLGRAR